MVDRVEHTEEPFNIVLSAYKVALQGDLDDSPGVWTRCRAVLEKVPRSSRLIVEAHDARIIPEGVTTWIKAVEQFLADCELTYSPSQLSLILQYDDRYQHTKSTFQESELPAVRVG